jgi:hypothetical protein
VRPRLRRRVLSKCRVPRRSHLEGRMIRQSESDGRLIGQLLGHPPIIQTARSCPGSDPTQTLGLTDDGKFMPLLANALKAGSERRQPSSTRKSNCLMIRAKWRHSLDGRNASLLSWSSCSLRRIISNFKASFKTDFNLSRETPA